MSDAESDYESEYESQEGSEQEIEEEEEAKPEGQEGEDDEDLEEPEMIQIKISNKRIPDTERTSSNILTDYELTRVIGTRAQELSSGNSLPYVEYTEDMTLRDIAIKELKERKIPYIIRRPINLDKLKYEEYKLSDLQILKDI